jgi:hypothetical protein
MSGPTPAGKWFVRGAAFLAIGLFAVLVGRFWHPVYGFTAFFQLDAPNEDLKISAFRELPVFVHRGTGGYDGLYYAQIAHDPSLRDPELPRAMDNYAYRARRILPPALAWLLGAGQPAWIIHTYSLINVAAWIGLAWLVWRILAVRDVRSWLAWAGVLFSAGALSSVRLALTDLTALALMAAAFLAVESSRNRLAGGYLALAALARETSVPALFGLCEAPWFSRKNVIRVVVAIVPLAAWLTYVRWRIGPADAGWANFTWPGSGLVEKWGAVVDALSTVGDKPLAWTTLLATLAISTQAAFMVLKPRWGDRWWRLGAVYTVMMLFLGTAVWEGFPGAATRVLLPLNLAFNVLACRTRASAAWLLVGNLTVFAGLLAMRDVPHDANELVAQRLGDRTGIVRFEKDWFGREETRRHTWLWSRRQGTLTLEMLPPSQKPVRVEFGLRSLVPRKVTLRVNGRDIWQSDVRETISRHNVTVPVTAGALAKLEFFTDTPGIPESTGPGARELAFALYDLRLAPSEP